MRQKPQLRLVPPNVSPVTPDWQAAPPLGAVYRRYAPYVGRIALRLLGRRDEIEDVIQDVFVEAVRGLRALRDPDAIRGWLAAVTTRVCGRRLRMKRFRRFLGLESAPDFSALEAPGATAEQRALLACVYNVLDGLPVDARTAWILRNVEGEALESIAVMCRCSLATIKRRIAAAQTSIEEALGDA